MAAAAVKAEMCPPDLYDRACAVMIRLNKGARDAMIEVQARSATDVTGFGLMGHTYEMASGSGTEIVIHASAVPYLEGSLELLNSGTHQPHRVRDPGCAEGSPRL